MRRPADTVSARDRWLALALLLGAVLAAYLLLVHPWFTQPMRALGEHIDTLQERELRIRRELDQAPEVRAALDQARDAMATMPGFMPQASVELATAALVQRLEQLVPLSEQHQHDNGKQRRPDDALREHLDRRDAGQQLEEERDEAPDTISRERIGQPAFVAPRGGWCLVHDPPPLWIR